MFHDHLDGTVARIIGTDKLTVIVIKRRCIAFILWSLTVIVSICFPAGLHAGVPTDQVRATVDKVLEILNDPKLASQAAKEERRSRLRQVIYPRFDFADMARRCLGSTWQRISRREQEEFVKLFTQLLEESYVSNIESYSGEKLLYGREIQEQDFAEVDTKIVPKGGEEIALNYKLHKMDGDWKVYDVVIENISMVNNYRSQLSRLLGKYSFAEVIDIIREKLPR